MVKENDIVGLGKCLSRNAVYPAGNCMLTTETLEQGVEYVQNWQ